MKLKYPLKLKDTLYPAGTTVKLASSADFLKQHSVRLSDNPDNTEWTGILVGDDDHAIIVASKQIHSENTKDNHE
jgi:hypothetical protein|tara:strand:+ start:318 stop:542 length:225 start_codon:yes stop_codon:yes gene_type:complete